MHTFNFFNKLGYLFVVYLWSPSVTKTFSLNDWVVVKNELENIWIEAIVA
jgi:hypothetical protein